MSHGATTLTSIQEKIKRLRVTIVTLVVAGQLRGPVAMGTTYPAGHDVLLRLAVMKV